MSRYPNPCDNCERDPCLRMKCPDYLKYFLTIWKQFNTYPARSYRKNKVMNGEKYVYEHPDIIRRYLHDGPCGVCSNKAGCDTPCLAYWGWWDERMEWLKRMFENG